ncbi:hypothetical protein F2P81_015567 [Scophthalmus maximus]|uniref:Uncharacterized protein n=1 Tax=Scophthalmus maximus TaxID=52904 RepID=A0A6A4SJ41_SCOMX|nr:hypothetical protein F2P81_015567 [Scophthalmus maximus]
MEEKRQKERLHYETDGDSDESKRTHNTSAAAAARNRFVGVRKRARRLPGAAIFLFVFERESVGRAAALLLEPAAFGERKKQGSERWSRRVFQVALANGKKKSQPRLRCESRHAWRRSVFSVSADTRETDIPRSSRHIPQRCHDTTNPVSVKSEGANVQNKANLPVYAISSYTDVSIYSIFCCCRFPVYDRYYTKRAISIIDRILSTIAPYVATQLITQEELAEDAAEQQLTAPVQRVAFGTRRQHYASRGFKKTRFPNQKIPDVAAVPTRVFVPKHVPD